jgi:hypothetical protein
MLISLSGEPDQANPSGGVDCAEVFGLWLLSEIHPSDFIIFFSFCQKSCLKDEKGVAGIWC